MEAKHSNIRQQERRRWLIVAVALGLSCLILAGEQMRLRIEAASGPNQSLIAQAQTQMAGYNAKLQLQGSQKEQTIERARLLREEWRVWALLHQDELKRMLNANAKDEAVLASTWRLIPNIPNGGSDGIESNDLKDESRKISFNWNAVIKAPIANSDDKDRQDRSQEYLTWRMRQDFAQMRDLQISESLNTGKTSITLWASGRITEKTKTDQLVHINSNLNANMDTNKEIIPTFDFLEDH